MFAAFLHPNSDSGWMSLDRYSRTLPPPSPSDDLRPPPSYCRRGVAVGCRFPPPDSPRSPGWRPLERCAMPLPPPSPSDNLRPPPPTAVAPWAAFGCFGTGLPTVSPHRRVTVNPDLAPVVIRRRGRRGRMGVAVLSFVGSWLWSDAPYARFVAVVELPNSPDGGSWGGALCLFLRHRPLTTSAAPLLPPSQESQ
ncbi:hypothetical protein EDB83DRAFT_2321311 [Lactarius deliciosus]|nr:hypothetical protein EDB83DRAFT_2321311 [Lactarius deliciosus]